MFHSGHASSSVASRALQRLSVLVIDGRSDARGTLADGLRRQGHTVHEAGDVRDPLIAAGGSGCDLALVHAPSNGNEWVKAISRVKTEWPDAEVIVFTERGDVAAAVHAIKTGACDYLQIDSSIDMLARVRRIAEERVPCSAAARGVVCASPHDVVLADPRMHELFARIDTVAEFDCTVLITGESGTGKEVIARRIFQGSRRRHRKFVPVNCGAIPAALAESELFGYQRGAFTDARTDRPGLIEEAEGGVLFLDEIGETSIRGQVSLLRFLDTGEVRRVGDTHVQHANVRVIAATNRPLQRSIRTGRFRADLFYRLSVVSIHLPPLRERRADIPALAEHFLRRGVQRLGRRVRQYSPEAMALLERYSWPGNVRELQNVVDSAIVVASSDTIRPKDLPASIQQGESAHVWGFGDADHEPKRAKMAAKRSRGAMTAAAAALGISRTTLWRHLRDARASTLVGERADRAMANDAPAPVRRRDEPEKRPSRPRQSRTTMLNDAES